MATKPGKSARQLLTDDTVEAEEPESKPKATSKRGAKQLSTPKPKGAARVILDSPVLTNRPVSVYKERITDADSGETDYYLWWTTEDSKVIGREEITKFNPKTERETTVGYDYIIPYSDAEVKKVLAMSFSKTKFYNKDGNGRFHVPNPATNF